MQSPIHQNHHAERVTSDTSEHLLDENHAIHTGTRASMTVSGKGRHDTMHMISDATRPQLVAVTVLTLLALLTGILWSATFANLRIGAHDVAGAVMPPGMIMT